ncbi:oxidoreductase [Synechococcus sp. CCY 9618]|uniref:oxidoreductase n=1 Tax=Synechococcus sp. CCY 9618 TaxID=2815602 RepID=UPI001C222BA5|nr:oxidoreductase [Synechococcus sp. CCY 9618]
MPAFRIPEQSGRIALVTGANSGLGLETARALSARGATVILACLSLDLAEQARVSLLPTATGPLEKLELDLGDLDVVARASESVASRFGKLDLLINNAGVMGLPWGLTKNGYEQHFGINHLGHFALTQHLMPLFKDRPGARVVTVTSIWQHIGRFRLDDLRGRRKYNRWKAYAQSKFANTCFGFELQERLSQQGAKAISLVAHPGFARTNIQAASIKASGNRFEAFLDCLVRPFFQSAAEGARCQIYAATSPTAKGGEIYAPNGPLESGGWPKRGRAPKRALDHSYRRQLWQISEELCHRHWNSR